jgi:pimeloyl-ACP methyl ester carboxylesterase
MTTATNLGSYANVNGINLYYQLHGEGDPLILLHGGFGLIEMFEPLLPALRARHQVIGVDLQAHGRTADIDRPMSYAAMADDVAALINHLGLTSVDVVGYSMGGGVALQVAIRHPALVRKLVTISAPFKSDGWYPDVAANIGAITEDLMKGTIPYEAYINVAPDPTGMSHLIARMKELTQESYDWSAGVAALTMPTLIVVGDADSVQLDHALEMFRLLGGGTAANSAGVKSKSQLVVLPGQLHWELPDRPDLLLPVLASFLDAPSATNS